jgi:serine protease Do/serine protease DegQ
VGIGFAVPAVIARAVMDQLIRFGEVRRGRLGVAMQDVVGGEGSTITDVVPNSPAAQAGLRKGDVVNGLNGRPVRSAAELRARLSIVPVGEAVELQVQRGAEALKVKATIAEVERRQSASAQAIDELAGASFADAIRGRDRAVTVTAVEAGSPAFEHGLRAGDLIVGVNQRRITSVQLLGRALRASGPLAINVVRGETVLAIPIR